MKTVLTALTTLGSCTAAHWYLDRESRQDQEYCGGNIRLRALWNDGAAFGLGIRKNALLAASFAMLGSVWFRRKERPVSAGLVLGGGISNLLERLRGGKVYDYVQFPKAPGKLKRYVFNAADFAIFLGAAGMAVRRKKKT